MPSEEDFLFHLYRGSELLGDNRLLEAQSELEYALSLEPADARTLGLLAVVYFRSGFHARAIATYRGLLRDRPADATLRLNLALCYLKTGESDLARVELESLVTEDDGDARTWGYLALALDRLGYVEQAREAFERAGQPELARHLGERRAWKMPQPLSYAPDSNDSRQRPRNSTFNQLDEGKLRLDLVRVEGRLSEPWGTTRSATPSLSVSGPPPGPPPRAPARHETLGWGIAPEPAATLRAWLHPPPLSNFIEDARVERLGDASGVSVFGTRLARVELDATVSPMGFAFRVDALRSYHGALDPEILPRQTRSGAVAGHDTAGETFGGIGAPFASMKGPGQLLLGPRASLRIASFTLHDEVVFAREEALLGFDLALHYENGRLALGENPGEGAPIVQLRGAGTLLLDVPSDLFALDVKAGGITVRKDVVVAWVGRLVPRPFPLGEAPCGQRGLLGFSGEGTILVSAK